LKRKLFQIVFKLAFVIIILVCISCSEEKKIISSDKLQIHGNIVYEVNSENTFSGKVIDKYETGQKKTETIYKDGVKNGLETMWHKNGQKKEETKFEEGDLVEILEGSFKGLCAKVYRPEISNNRVSLLIEILGNSVEIKVKPKEIEKV